MCALIRADTVPTYIHQEAEPRDPEVVKGVEKRKGIFRSNAYDEQCSL